MSDKDNENPPPTPFSSREPSQRSEGLETLSPIEYPTFEMDTKSIRKLDSIAVEEFGIPGIALMENASSALNRHCIEMLEPLTNRRVAIFCGPGNNGGDGLGLARHLHGYQIDLSIVLLAAPDSFGSDALINLRAVQRMGLDITVFDAVRGPQPGLVVDALFGTGLSRPPEGKAAAMVAEMNHLREHGARTLAVDIPSGLDAQTGTPMNPCVIADRTVTFAATKSGFSALGAQSVLGQVAVEGIGLPIELLERFGTRLCRTTMPDQ
jgi:hydroxyethylthiazole kinase-like uncharacterized protein yjeF